MAAAADLGVALGGAYRTFRRQQLMVVCSCHHTQRRATNSRKKEKALSSVCSPAEFKILAMIRSRGVQASSKLHRKPAISRSQPRAVSLGACPDAS